MHRLAFQLRTDVLEEMMEFLQQGLQQLCDGRPPVVAGVSRIGLAADSYEIDADGFVGNPNIGNPSGRGSRKRKQEALEQPRLRLRPPPSLDFTQVINSMQDKYF